MDLEKFTEFLKTIDLKSYRERFLPIKIVEMDLPKNIQAISLLYKMYWEEKRFISFDDFYNEYLRQLAIPIEEFRKKTRMCEKCFYLGLPARIYRTWASLITQIHAGYVAESVFGSGTVEMSEFLDHLGADFRVRYDDRILNYQVKKESFSREVRKAKESKKEIEGEFVDIFYIVPSSSVFQDPKTKKGEYRKPYERFISNRTLERFENGFVVFTPYLFIEKKSELDSLSRKVSGII